MGRRRSRSEATPASYTIGRPSCIEDDGSTLNNASKPVPSVTIDQEACKIQAERPPTTETSIMETTATTTPVMTVGSREMADLIAVLSPTA